MNYSDLHKALDEAAYEILVSYRRKLANEIDKLQDEKNEVDDLIAKKELERQASL